MKYEVDKRKDKTACLPDREKQTDFGFAVRVHAERPLPAEKNEFHPGWKGARSGFPCRR